MSLLPCSIGVDENENGNKPFQNVFEVLNNDETEL